MQTEQRSTPKDTAPGLGARLAVTVFPVLVLAAGALGLLAPLLTPSLTLLLAGEYLPVHADSMVTDILKTVLVPVIAGFVLRTLADRLVTRMAPVLPWLSVAAVALIVAIVVAGSAEAITSAAGAVFLAVVLHNGLGLLLGYAAGRAGRLGERGSRALTFEVGMQNSGLAAALATAHFSPLAALPAAIFSVWHNVSGALVAAWFSRRPTDD